MSRLSSHLIASLNQPKQRRRHRESKLEARQNQFPGNFLNNTSRRSRVSEFRLLSTSSSGLVLFRNIRSSHLSLPNTTSFLLFRTETTSVICKKCVDALIGIFNAETDVQNKIQDAGKNTDTITSAAMAVPIPKGTAILLNVIHFLINAFDNDSAASSVDHGAARPRSLALPSIFQYYCLCPQQFFHHPHSPSDRLPDYVP